MAPAGRDQPPGGPDRCRIAAIGSFAYVIAGQGPTGPLDSTARANISPLPPYFQLGILGATIPGLSIKGEIGQQLGYINAMTVGMINFVLLVVLGYAMSHREASMRLMEKLSRGRSAAATSRAAPDHPSTAGSRRTGTGRGPYGGPHRAHHG